MKTKLQRAFRWFLAVIVALAVLLGCGFLASSWWGALGSSAQQIILVLSGVGFAYYCLTPLVGLVIVFLLIFAYIYFTSR